MSRFQFDSRIMAMAAHLHQLWGQPWMRN
jgi:hypothetical protein